jgi:hypothetical protein
MFHGLTFIIQEGGILSSPALWGMVVEFEVEGSGIRIV